KKRSPETAKAFAAADDRLRRGLANQRKALEVVANAGALLKPPSYIALDPFLIWAQSWVSGVQVQRPNILVDSHIGHFDSWAKINYRTHKDTGIKDTYDTLTFYYVWENPSDSDTVVNAECSLILSGSCYASANTGIIDGGYSYLSLLGAIKPYEWWHQP